MSSNPFNKPLVLITKRTTQKLLLIAIPHSLAFVITLTVPYFTLNLRLIILLFIALSFSYFSRLHLFTSLKKSVLSIKQDSAKNWFILNRGSKNNEYKEVVLLPSTFISNILIIQNFSDPSQQGWSKPQYTAIFTPDSISAEEFRRLKVRIKVNKSNKNI